MTKGVNPNSPAEKTARAERIAQAMELVKNGLTYRQIAAEMGIGLKTAWTYVKEGIAAIPAEAANELRAVENSRLELLWEQLMDRLDSGEEAEKVIEIARKVGESRRKLWGLDAPAQIQGEFTVGYTINGVDPEAMT